MLKILTILCCFIVVSTSAQTANSKDNWEITIKSDTATYHLKLIADIDIVGYSVKLKRNATAKFHKMTADAAGTFTSISIYQDKITENILPLISYGIGEKPLPYFDISGLKAGKYGLWLMGCGNGGFIQFDLE